MKTQNRLRLKSVVSSDNSTKESLVNLIQLCLIYHDIVMHMRHHKAIVNKNNEVEQK